MNETVMILIGLVVFIGFIYGMHYGLFYIECHYANINTVLNAIVLIAIIGLIIFGDKITKLTTLSFVAIVLVVSAIESAFSFKGVIPELAEKEVACKK